MFWGGGGFKGFLVVLGCCWRVLWFLRVFFKGFWCLAVWGSEFGLQVSGFRAWS